MSTTSQAKKEIEKAYANGEAEAAALADRVKDASQQAVEKARDTASVTLERSQSELRRVTEQSGNFVRENPGIAVAGALGVGVLLGLALRVRD